MKSVEVRRHSISGPDKNITPGGLELARRATHTLRPTYDLYICSPAPRCIQTMEAFSFSNYEVDEGFGPLPEPGPELKTTMERVGRLAEVRKLTTLEAMFLTPEVHKLLRDVGDRVLEAVRRVAGRLPEGGSALVVSHGGSIEPAAVITLKRWDLNSIGGPLNPCEGVIFYLEGDEIKDIKVVRFEG